MFSESLRNDHIVLMMSVVDQSASENMIALSKNSGILK